MTMNVFGIKGMSCHSACERDKIWSGRLSIAGTRVVAMLSAPALMHHMHTAGILGVDMKTFFRDIRGDGLQALLSSTPIWHSTVGAGEFLFIPANYIVLEHVAKHDVVGLRMGVLASKDARGKDLFAATASSPATPSDDISKLIVDAIDVATASRGRLS